MTQKNHTNTQSSTTNQYNQGAESQYNSLIGAGGNALQQEIQNPFNNMFFNTQLGMGQQQLNQQNSSAMSAMQQRAQALGQSGNSALMNYQIGAQQRQNAAGNSGLFNNLLLQAGNQRQGAIGSALSFNPQQTGQSSTSSSQQYQTGGGQYIAPAMAAAGAFLGAPQTGGANVGGWGAATVSNQNAFGSYGGSGGGASIAAPSIPQPTGNTNYLGFLS